VATMTIAGDRYWITSSAVANSVSGTVRPGSPLAAPMSRSPAAHTALFDTPTRLSLEREFRPRLYDLRDLYGIGFTPGGVFGTFISVQLLGGATVPGPL
jgi:hypothetical protein